jgi:hypothetical protein
MNGVVGFTIFSGIPDADLCKAKTAQNRALDHFKWLNKKSISIGEAQVDLWGHNDLSGCAHRLPEGDLLLLIGSPVENISWLEIEKLLSVAKRNGDINIPWNGRVILIRISADGKSWTMWNDWLGSIPVFYAQSRGGRIASTIEPVVVAAEGYGPDDFFLPGLVALFVDGHLIGDWTLYKDMKIVPPDCVFEWKKSGLRWHRYFTVAPSQDMWEEGWDELVDQMYELSRQAIVDVLVTQPNWIIPLSAGLDSRLIAAVAAELRVNACSYSWGEYKTKDPFFAHQIAKKLDIPWKLIRFDHDFLVNYTRMWANLFGSAMVFHGVYMMSFLDALRTEMSGRVAIGLIGEALAGYAVRFLMLHHSTPNNVYSSHPVGYSFCTRKEVESLFRFSLEDAFEEYAAEIQRQIDCIPGSRFQQVNYLTFRGRQRMFTNFQSTLCDYWRGVATPFLNKHYARFCLSLPRAVLENRRLQGDMFRRFYPDLATIPGTYWPGLFVPTENYIVKRKIAMSIPWPLRLGPLKEFNVFTNPKTWNRDSVQENGWKALWPIREAWYQLSEWVNLNVVTEAYQATLDGNQDSINKLRPVQMFAYRLLDQ